MFNGVNGVIKGSQRGHMRHKGAMFRRPANNKNKVEPCCLSGGAIRCVAYRCVHIYQLSSRATSCLLLHKLNNSHTVAGYPFKTKY